MVCADHGDSVRESCSSHHSLVEMGGVSGEREGARDDCGDVMNRNPRRTVGQLQWIVAGMKSRLIDESHT